jgi:hypothetical protein
LPSGGAIERRQVLMTPPEQTLGMTADVAPWPLVAGLMFTAYAFTMAWRFLRQRRNRRR